MTRALVALLADPTVPRDVLRVMRRFRAVHGAWPRLLAPRTLNDFMMRSMVLDRRPIWTRLADKLEARRFAIERLGVDASVPVLAVCDRGADIPWDSLPPAFILKANHGSGWNIAVPDAATADRVAIAAQFDDWLGRCYADLWQEWAYRNIAPRILAEPLLPSPGEGAPPDLRIFAFGGVTHLIRLRRTAPGGTTSFCHFDMDGRPLSFRMGPQRHEAMPFPTCDLAWIKATAATLSAGFDFLRVDFLLDGDRVWLGELTVSPGARLEVADPPAWGLWLGALWRAAQAGRAAPPPPGS